jgi:DNA-binding transcriptional ArsR family regulator
MEPGFLVSIDLHIHLQGTVREEIDCMSIRKPPAPSAQQPEGQFHHRPAEIDAFVDHFLSTMCDATRRRILELLAIPESNDQELPIEMRSGDIARELALSPATISGHLRQLSEAGLLTSRRDGNAIYYRLRNHVLVRTFKDLLHALDNEHPSHRKS